MSDQSLAKVDDVIERGQSIPDDVTEVREPDGDLWRLTDRGWYCPRVWPDGEPDTLSGYTRQLSMMRGPLTVTAVCKSEPLARVDDVIQYGQDIPGNVVAFTDIDGDPWRRTGPDVWTWLHDDSHSLSDFRARPGWWPMTVVEVDPEPEPQPVARRLVGPPHAHLDAPCTDACYEPAESGPGDREPDPREVADHHLMTALGVDRLDGVMPAIQSLQADRAVLVQVMAELGVDRVEDVLVSLEKRFNALVMARTSREENRTARLAAEAEIQRLLALAPEVEPGPLVPQVPDDLDRFLAERLKDPEFAAAFEDAGVRPRLVLRLTALRNARGLTVEQVAKRMQMKPKRVREYEGGVTDPTLSMHQCYARAVGARITVEVIEP